MSTRKNVYNRIFWMDSVITSIALELPKLIGSTFEASCDIKNKRRAYNKSIFFVIIDTQLIE